MKIFTIGYGGLGPSAFVQVLKEHSVESVVDIRIWPIRASMGSYILSKSPEKGIQGLLARHGIAYFSLLELGNPFFQGMPDWKNRYQRLIGAAGDFLTERLTNVPEPLCLLCSEKDPADCHRWILGDFLKERGHEVEHLIVQTRQASSKEGRQQRPGSAHHERPKRQGPKRAST
jgi:uncharacterized protein (DUF488 family)